MVFDTHSLYFLIFCVYLTRNNDFILSTNKQKNNKQLFYILKACLMSCHYIQIMILIRFYCITIFTASKLATLQTYNSVDENFSINFTFSHIKSHFNSLFTSQKFVSFARICYFLCNGTISQRSSLHSM